MRVRVVAVGDELLLGTVVDTNTAEIGRRLAEAGLRLVGSDAVPDDIPAIVDAVRTAARRADAVVVSGGLGPTSDDVTRQALASAAGVTLRPDEGVLARLHQWYAERFVTPSPAALGQADVPEGAELLDNPTGSAPGLALRVEGVPVLAVPGVPAELRRMLDGSVVPRLRSMAGAAATLVTRTLHVVGVGESDVAARLAPFEADLDRDAVRLAYLAEPAVVRVRLTVEAPDDAAARAALEAPVLQVRRLLGEDVAGIDRTPAEAVLGTCQARGQRVAVAESLTGGGVAEELTTVAGSSTVVLGGVVAYAAAAKRILLGVPQQLLETRGTVDPDVAAAMAEGVRSCFAADWGLATTGVAGPGPSEGHQAGTVYLAVSGAGTTGIVRVAVTGDRAVVRRRTVVLALDLLRRRVDGLAAPGWAAQVLAWAG